MIFIKDLKENESHSEIYLVKMASKSITATGKNYLSLVLADKTGTISAKKWDILGDDLEIFKVGKFVQVSFDVTVFKEKLELKIRDARSVNVTKLDDYIPTSPIKEEDLVKKLDAYIKEITDSNLKAIVDEVMKLYKDKFITYPAASNNHHAFRNGLLYHTVSMLEVASFLLKHYNNIDKDIILTATLFHDLGKVKELSGLLPIEYTYEGRMLGHLVIAVNIINNVATKLKLENNDKVIAVEHAILASHGKYEYGSPVLGMSKEAILLNFIDDLDAKMMMYENNTKDLNPGEFTKTISTLDNRRLYKKK